MVAAVQMLRPRVDQEFGEVLERAGARVRVALHDGERWTHLAPSCLLSPAVGDRVLVVHGADEAYVLAVLERDPDAEAHVLFERDVAVDVVRGKLRLTAREGVEVTSPKSVDVRAGTLAATFDRGRAAFSTIDLVGQAITSTTNKVRVVTQAFDTIAGRIYQRAVHFLRRTDELDRVEAKNIDLRARQLLHVHGENTVSTADHLVKIDAGQVHVG